MNDYEKALKIMRYLSQIKHLGSSNWYLANGDQTTYLWVEGDSDRGRITAILNRRDITKKGMQLIGSIAGNYTLEEIIRYLESRNIDIESVDLSTVGSILMI